MVLNYRNCSHSLTSGSLLGLGVIGFSLVAVTLLVQRALPTIDPHSIFMLKLLLIAPMIEEGFFRGVVHAGLLGRTDVWGRPAVANVITALFFGAAHLWFAPWLHALTVMLPALVIGWVYERSRSVGVCIALHCLCNAFLIVWRY